jgi:gamma-glutamylcysteine synthetase
MNAMSGTTMASTMQSAFWQRYGNAAQMASALVAILALGAIYWQVQFNFRLSRDNNVHEIYRAYLQMAVQYPRLAYPESDTAVASMTREDKARYGWFVSYLLYTCEQILGSFPNDREWQRTCEEQIGYHAPYVCSTVLRDEIGNYDPPMRALIQKVASTAAECKKT